MPNEYVLKSDGRVLRRPVELTVQNETEIAIDDAILSTLTLSITRKVHRLAFLPEGVVHQCVTSDSGESFLSLRLARLKILATVKTNEGIVRPAFEPQGDFIPLEWIVPGDMRLMFVARCQPERDGTYFCQWAYLFALNGNGRQAYKMPLPNLYADCHICLGVSGYFGNSLLECFQNTLQGFTDSKWNADLIHGDERRGILPCFDQSQDMFIFKPVKDGFETLPPAAPWASLCEKVGTAVLEFAIL